MQQVGRRHSGARCEKRSLWCDQSASHPSRKKRAKNGPPPVWQCRLDGAYSEDFTAPTRLRVSSAEKLLEGLEVSGGAVVIFLRLGGLAVFGGVLGTGGVGF